MVIGSVTVSKMTRIIIGLLALICLMMSTLPVVAAGEGLSDVTDKSTEIGQPVAITDLQITGEDNEELVITVHALSGSFTFTETVAEVTGSGTNVVTLSGTKDDINATLATMQFTPSDIGEVTITADLGNNVGDVIFNNGEGGNGHAYIVVKDNDMTWSQAKAKAETYTFGGQTGYLATITDQVENDFVWNNLQDTGWIGATDNDSETGGEEGKWYWVTGPEAGTQFWDGDPFGVPVGEEYTNWEPGTEPNNSGEEDCGQFWNEGYWNDYPCDYTRPFVVEFGGGGELEPIQEAFTITASAPNVEIDTCEELTAVDDGAYAYLANISLTTDIDCGGQTIEPLFMNSEHDFEGTIDGGGHTISNVIINEEDNYVGLIGEVNSATISDLNIEDIAVTGRYEVGSLIGYVGDWVKLNNVHAHNVNVTATEEGYVGGLIGTLYTDAQDTSEIYDVSVTGNVYSGGEYNGNIGGLVGYIESSGKLQIRKTYTNVDIESTQFGDYTYSDVGGLVGAVEVNNNTEEEDYTASATFEDVYAWGDISAEGGDNVGGLAGRLDIEYYDEQADANMEITIENTYARGKVMGASDVGGLVGQVDKAVSESAVYNLSNSFAMGRVTALAEDANSAGLIGNSEDNDPLRVVLNDNFYDQERTGQEACVGGSGAATGCSYVNPGGIHPLWFIGNSTNPPMVYWDFENVWVVNQDAPPTFAPYELGEDLNGDLVPDVEQSNISGYTSPITGKKVAIDVGDDCEITTDDIVQESNLDSQDKDYDYANGLFDFAADCGDAGFTTTVSLYYYGVEKHDAIARKFNPNTNQYSTIADASISETTIHGSPVTVVTYQMTDGGELDMDGQVNGSFEDPAGLASSNDSLSLILNNLAATGQNVVGLYLVIALPLFTSAIAFVLYRINRTKA